MTIDTIDSTSRRTTLGWGSAIVGGDEKLPELARAVWRVVPTEITLEFGDWSELLDAARKGFCPDLLVVDATGEEETTGLLLEAIRRGELPGLDEAVIACFGPQEFIDTHDHLIDVAAGDPTPENTEAALARAVRAIDGRARAC
jgi:hypothetical protein